VLVLHQDGTVARYLHAREDGFEVTDGAYVRRGDRVIEVGSTGCSTGPHLHFDVVKEEGSGKTVQISFESAVSGAETCYSPDKGSPVDSTNVEN